MTNDDYERSLNARNRELEANIEKVLRGVLELPADERSFAANSWESDACRGASQTASKILIASFAPPPIAKTPKTVAKDLATIKKKSGYLRAQIAAIDGYTRGVINRAGSTHHQEYKAAEADGDLERFIDAFQKALKQAVHYGMYDLARLENIILSYVAGDFFNIDEDD